jgi:hypothetical protein
MDRESDITLRSQLAELTASFLLPGKPGDEGKLQGAVALLDETVEKGGVIPVRREI